MGKKLSKHIAAFDYIDKNLIFLSATSGGISFFEFSFTIIHNSQDCKGRRRAFLKPLTTSPTSFTDT